MSKKKQLFSSIAVLLMILVAIIYALYFLCMQMGAMVAVDKYPPSTLSKSQTSYEPIKPGEAYEVLLQCPTFPYNIYLPGDTYKTVSSAVVVGLQEPAVSIIVEESVLSMEEYLTDCVRRIGVTTFKTATPQLSTVVSDMGYINGFSAQYWAGSLEGKGTIEPYCLYGVCYRLEQNGKVLYVGVFSRNESDLEQEKMYLDTIVMSLAPIEEADVENTVKDTVSSSDVANETSTTILDEDYEEYMNSTTTAFKTLPISFQVKVEEVMDNGVFVFQWINTDIYPIQLAVKTPDGRVVYYDDEESFGGMYAYYLGNCPAGIYTIEGTTAVTLEGCLFYVCEEWYYRQEVLHEETED